MPLLFKNIFTAVVFITLLTTVLSGVIPIRLLSADKADNETEIIRVVKGAVEDTNWLHVSSKQEMEQLMEAYYTGDLLTEVSNSGWRFVSRPNSWEYVVSTGSIDVEVISAKEGSAHVEILEKDEISGHVYSSRFNYFLIKNDNGWKIITRNVCIP